MLKILIDTLKIDLRLLFYECIRILPKASRKKIAKQANKPPTYWEYVKRQFAKNKRALYASYVVIFLLFVAIFADFLANDKPIVMKYNGSWYAPVLKEHLMVHCNH